MKKIHKNRLYSYNENYFSDKSLQACYWAGFIAADGCITNIKHGQDILKIKLNIIDKNHLIQFKNDIEYNGIIENIKSCNGGMINGRQIRGGESVRLGISSQKIVNDLANIFGIYSRKTLTHEPPIGLTEKQEFAFIIGYIDGDGSISKINAKCKYPIIFQICGTESFLNWSLLVLKKLSNINSKIQVTKRKNNKIHNIKFSNKFAYEILKSLNQSKIFKLERKWVKVKEFIPNFNSLKITELNSLKTHCKRGHEFDKKIHIHI
jgi:hypothetical protein